MVKKITVATSFEEAKGLTKGSAMPLAGGTELLRLGGSGCDKALVALPLKSGKQIEKTNMKEYGKNDREALYIGFGVTFTEALNSSLVPSTLKEALVFCSSLQKRNMATVCGNVGAARSDSYLIPTLASLGAKVVTKAHKEIVEILEWAKTPASKRVLIEGIVFPLGGVCYSIRFAATAASHSVATVALGKCPCGKIHVTAAINGTGIVDMADLVQYLTDNPKAGEEEVTDFVKKSGIAGLKSDPLYGTKEFKLHIVATLAGGLAQRLKEAK